MKVIKGYIAMNKDEYDIDNISFHATKAEASRMGASQVIKKVVIVIED